MGNTTHFVETDDSQDRMYVHKQKIITEKNTNSNK